jgi:hypothetical protein
VNDLSRVVEGTRDISEVLEQLDLSLEVDRPGIVRVKLNLPDPSTFEVRSLLAGLRQQQPHNHDWHVLALLEARPDPDHENERTLYETLLRDFRDMAECSAVTFGRSSSSDWVLPNAFISRNHGMAVLDDQLEVIVFDGRPADASTNGLFYKDCLPHITMMQRLQSPEEYVSFGPAISGHDGWAGYLFRLRIAWVAR